jgi:low affinity Fe/Cu permease
MQARFAWLACIASLVAGSAWMFLGLILAFVAWLGWGAVAGWTEMIHLWPISLLTWFTQVTIVLVQHTQTRQEEAMQRKLDALIYAVDKADNRLIGLEKQPPDAGSG